MDCTRLTEAQMSSRVARFDALRTVDFAALNAGPRPDLPREAIEIIEFGSSRRLFTVVGPESGADTAITADAPIRGAGGMTMTYVTCRPGAGAGLHAHVGTYETFVVLEGRFEVTYNDDGAGVVELGRFDVVSVPPGVVRAFRNIGDADGVLQVIVTGGVHDLADLEYAPAVADQLLRYGDAALAHYRRMGFRFDARDVAPPS